MTPGDAPQFVSCTVPEESMDEFGRSVRSNGAGPTYGGFEPALPCQAIESLSR